MKKYLKMASDLLLGMLLLAGCEHAIKAPKEHRLDANGTSFTVKVIDSCEYIEVYEETMDGQLYSLCHKGNCPNPIHHYGRP